ncbi:MAG TPA: class 1 fructose-bisphosphatase, partial [Cytophagaceae bacterium]|nr:class 1 fructose-bisphosphatase [Cytophagaceae bacterium]
KTLSQFIAETQREVPFQTGDLARLIQDISIAAKIVNREINKAGLADMLGAAGSANIHGEDVQKLDEFANDEFLSVFRAGDACCVIASEENEKVIPLVHEFSHRAKYAVLIDPIDGSSNTEVNVSIGTIFSIYTRLSENGPGTEADCLQKGTAQVAAGYVIYGSCTMLVYSTGNGVNGFTLDPSIGEFCLSHPNMRIPEGKFYSINEGNFQRFEEGIQKFITYCQEEKSGSASPYISRHIGSMVADFHRNLIKGGVFIYPASKEYLKGKLRLMYECNPMAFLIEQAGGKASDGYNRILEINPYNIHQRTPLIIGSVEMVEEVEHFLKQNTSPSFKNPPKAIINF